MGPGAAGASNAHCSPSITERAEKARSAAGRLGMRRRTSWSAVIMPQLGGQAEGGLGTAAPPGWVTS